jgi:ABC-type transport system involved in multi-copper enzyme maturation permease subunit
MHSILAIADVTFKDALRKKVLFTILFFAVLMTVVSGLLPTVRPDDRVRQAAKIGLSGIGFFGMVVGIFLSAPSLPDDISRKTIFSVMTKPARRWQIIAGKIVGLGLVLAVILAVMGGIAYVCVRFWAWKAGPSEDGMPRLQGHAAVHATQIVHEHLTLPVSGAMIESRRAIASGFQRLEYRFTGLDKRRYEGDTVFVRVRVFSHAWSFDPQTKEGTGMLLVANPTTGETKDIIFGPQNDIPQYVSFPRSMIDREGRLMIVLGRRSASGSISAAADSIAILSQPSGYTANFVKGMAMMFMQYMVLVFIAVAASTLLTSTVSIIFALFVYFTGSLTEILRDQALALGSEVNIFTMAEHTHEGEVGLAAGYQWFINIVLRYFYLGISVVFPNLSSYNVSEAISRNEYVPWASLLHGLWYGAVYAILAFAAAWAIFRRKEVA